jgi:hypothetical protein
LLAPHHPRTITWCNPLLHQGVIVEETWPSYAADLSWLASEITTVEAECRQRLNALYGRRAQVVREALAAGHTQATIAGHLGITHTAVQKIRRRALTSNGP